MTYSNRHRQRLNRYIDLDRYSIREPDSRAARDVIAQGHEMMARDTLCLFEGFLRPAAVAEIREEITATLR